MTLTSLRYQSIQNYPRVAFMYFLAMAIFWARKKRQEERFLIRKKSSRAIRVILYTRILARILARTTRAQTNLFVSVSFEREREKIEKEREKSFSLCLFVCVCVCLSAFVSREVWSFKDGRRCGNSR